MLSKILDGLTGKYGLLWVALATALVLSIPLIAMQFTPEVNWTSMDFAAAGILLLATGVSYVLAARRFPKHRVAIGILLGIAFVYMWAEMAVGIFTNWGS